MITHETEGAVPTSLSKDEFDFEAAQLVREMRMGVDHDIEEVAERLGMEPLDLVAMAAASLVRSTGQPVLIVPIDDGRTDH